MMTTRATAMHHRTRFTSMLMWRNFVEAEVARVFHIIAWLLTPRQIPNEEIGKRRRNGHVLSSGSTICSEGCKVAACIVLIGNVQLNQQ